jgi:hypothetical protein
MPLKTCYANDIPKYDRFVAIQLLKRTSNIIDMNFHINHDNLLTYSLCISVKLPLYRDYRASFSRSYNAAEFLNSQLLVIEYQLISMVWA